MKFSDIEEQNWEQLAPYLDTCLLPLTGLDGTEKPWQATNALEKLRDFLDLIEIPFRGRIVTYPAAHYELLEEEGEWETGQAVLATEDGIPLCDRRFREAGSSQLAIGERRPSPRCNGRP